MLCTAAIAAAGTSRILKLPQPGISRPPRGPLPGLGLLVRGSIRVGAVFVQVVLMAEYRLCIFG